jgi:hypothetical protein
MRYKVRQQWVSSMKICKKLLQDIVEMYHVSLSEDIISSIRKSDLINWFEISFRLNLSEAFIREFQDKVHWCNISYFQVLSENFIREFKDKVSWLDICAQQTLSEEFIIEFHDKVNWFNLHAN